MANLPIGMPFTCGMCGLRPGPPAEGPCGTCPCVGKLPMWHLARLASGPFKQCRKIQHPVATTFLGSACPGQLVTRPRWRGLENARVGLLPLINSREAISIRVTNAQERSTIERTARELKTQRDAKSTKSTSNPPRQRKRSEAQKKGATQTQTGQRSPKQDHWHSHRVLLTFPLHLLAKKQRAPKRHDMDVPDELPDGHEDREHLADGGLRLTRCRHLESTRRPRKTKKTKKRKRHTVRAQRRENVSPRGKTQPAAREDVGSDEAYTTYFRKKGEPQRRLAADPGQGDSLEDIRKRASRPRGRACPERAARWCRAAVEHT